jgi:hypothetical protein
MKSIHTAMLGCAHEESTWHAFAARMHMGANCPPNPVAILAAKQKPPQPGEFPRHDRDDFVGETKESMQLKFGACCLSQSLDRDTIETGNLSDANVCIPGFIHSCSITY